MINKFVLLSKFYKHLILILLDSVSIVFAFLASFYIRLGYFYLPEGEIFWLILVTPIIAIPIFLRILKCMYTKFRIEHGIEYTRVQYLYGIRKPA